MPLATSQARVSIVAASDVTTVLLGLADVGDGAEAGVGGRIPHEDRRAVLQQGVTPTTGCSARRRRPTHVAVHDAQDQVSRPDRACDGTDWNPMAGNTWTSRGDVDSR